MKKIIFLLMLLISNYVMSQVPTGLSAYYYSNPYLSSSVMPSYYPTTIGIDRINIVAPSSVDLGSIKFPGVTISPANLSTPNVMRIDSYNNYVTVTNSDGDLVNSVHNFINGKLQFAVDHGTIVAGCTVVTRITVEAAKDWLPGFCPVAETPPTFAACAIGVALHNAVIQNAAQLIISQGCQVTVTKVLPDVWELTLKTFPSLQNAIDEAKFWISYINSIDGMIFIMNHIN